MLGKFSLLFLKNENISVLHNCYMYNENITVLHNCYMYTVYLREIVVLQIKIIYDRIWIILTRVM